MITAKILSDSLLRNIDIEKGIQDLFPGLQIWQSTVGGAKFKTFIDIEADLTPEFGDKRIQPNYLFLFVGTNELSVRDYPDKNYDNEVVFTRVKQDIETLIKWYDNAKRIFLVMPIARFDKSKFKLQPYINWMKDNIKLPNIKIIEYDFEFKREHFKLDGLHLNIDFQSEYLKLTQNLIINSIFEHQKQESEKPVENIIIKNIPTVPNTDFEANLKYSAIPIIQNTNDNMQVDTEYITPNYTDINNNMYQSFVPLQPMIEPGFWVPNIQMVPMTEIMTQPVPDKLPQVEIDKLLNVNNYSIVLEPIDTSSRTGTTDIFAYRFYVPDIASACNLIGKKGNFSQHIRSWKPLVKEYGLYKTDIAENVTIPDHFPENYGNFKHKIQMGRLEITEVDYAPVFEAFLNLLLRNAPSPGNVKDHLEKMFNMANFVYHCPNYQLNRFYRDNF